MKTINEYIEEHSKIRGVKKKLVQGRVPLPILKKVTQLLHKKHITWTDLITASLIQFIEQNSHSGTKGECHSYQGD